jgi:hypothetical protein
MVVRVGILCVHRGWIFLCTQGSSLRARGKSELVCDTGMVACVVVSICSIWFMHAQVLCA